jgi:hypothetical protein
VKRTGPDSGLWIGWHRPALPNATWREICQGHTFDACADLLAVLAGAGERQVLFYGQRPWQFVSEDHRE